MTEIAFLVKPDSEMYRKYFKQKNELDKFVGFASSFIDICHHAGRTANQLCLRGCVQWSQRCDRL